jgi:hypothetical protein
MSDTPLFPDEAVDIRPAVDRQEPVVWVRRLVVVPRLAPGEEPIRDIPFRPGLNIVRTEDRPKDETRVIGHSVGKTLLTRLIRYCLGESHFATEMVTARVATNWPEGYVLAEFRVEGQTWSVARPLRDGVLSDCRAAVTDDCLSLSSETKDMPGYREFTRSLERATTASIPEIPLPNAGRAMRWLDLLGWLARDHECRYRVYNEWREPDAASGTGKLVRDEASFLMRLAMGLVSAEESPLLAAHRKLLADLEETRKKIERLSRFIDSTFPLLRNRLGLSEAETGDDQKLVGGIFATRAREVVNEKVQSLRRLSADVRGSSKVSQRYQESLDATSALAVAKADLERTTGLKTTAEAQLSQRESSSVQEYYASFHLRNHCDLKECPFRPEKPRSIKSRLNEHGKSRWSDLTPHVSNRQHDVGNCPTTSTGP